MVALVGPAHSGQDDPSSTERIWRRLKFITRLGDWGRTLAEPRGSHRPSTHMNADSQMIAATTSTPGIAKVGAPRRQPNSGDFLATLCRQLEELDLRYCLLHSLDLAEGAPVLGVELTIDPEDRNRLPFLIQNLRNEGYLP